MYVNIYVVFFCVNRKWEEHNECVFRLAENHCCCGVDDASKCRRVDVFLSLPSVYKMVCSFGAIAHSNMTRLHLFWQTRCGAFYAWKLETGMVSVN